MYVGIDIGGTKTLVASLDERGVITEKIRFETSHDYDTFLHELTTTIRTLKHDDFHAGGVGAPGVIDRHHGRGLGFGNLPWKNINLQADIEHITHCPIVVENDAKMAALSEAMLVKHDYDRVLYITVSTGIGFGLVIDRIIDTAIGDGGGHAMLVQHHGKLEPWESFASGSAIVRRYGKMAKDIDDPATWKHIVRDLTIGMIELIALLQPEVVIIGGSVGTHFKKYGALLQAELEKYETPLMPIPKLMQAGRPEEAVLFGCYDLALTKFGAPHAVTSH